MNQRCKETLERAEELMQYFKGHKFKVCNVVDSGFGIALLSPIQFEQRRGEQISLGRSFFK